MRIADTTLSWTLEPIELNDQPHWSRSLPKLPTEAELLAAPIVQLRDLGALAPRNEDPMRLMQGKKSPVLQLSKLLEELVPMIESFRNPISRRQHWWQRFIGATLEREVTYLHACQQLENHARLANGLTHEVQAIRDGIRDEASGVRRQAEWLGELVNRASSVLGDGYTGERSKACFVEHPDYWARFARRVDNLNALQHSYLLSAEQFKLADAHAQAVQDRHTDISTVLVPLWRQRMGFELFSKTVDTHKE